MGNEKCFGRNVAVLFVYLERLEKEGYFAGFTKEDIKNFVDKQIVYFSGFKDNAERYEKLLSQKRGESGRNIFQVVSKGKLGYVDYKEEVGVTEKKISSKGGLSFLTKHDIELDIEMNESEHKKNDGIAIHTSLEYLDAELDYDNEEMLMSLGNTFSLHKLKDGLRENYQRIDLRKIKNILEQDSVFLELLDNMNIFASDEKQMSVEILLSSLFGLGDDFYEMDNDAFDLSHKILNSEAPIFFSGEQLKGSFISKKDMFELLSEIFKTLASEKIYQFLKISREGEVDESIHKVLDALLSKNAYSSFINYSIAEVKKHHDNEVLSAIDELQKGSILAVTQKLLANGLSSENNDILERCKKDDNFDITLRMKRNKKESLINFIPIVEGSGKNTTLQVGELSPYIYILDEQDPTVRNKKFVSARDINYIFNLSKKTSSIQILDFYKEGEKEVPLLFHRNDTMKYYLIKEDFLKENDNVLVVDEADSGADGKKARVMYRFAQESRANIIATGTAIGGTPQSIVSILAYNGKMSSDIIEGNKKEFIRQNGVFEVTSYLVASLVSALNYSEGKELCFSMYGAFKQIMESSDKKANVIGELGDILVAKAVPMLIELGIASEEKMNQLHFEREIPAVKRLFDSMLNVEKKVKISFENLVYKAISENSSLVKLVPAIAAPKTFASSISKTASDANFLVNTRSGMTGKAEKMLFSDLETYMKNFEDSSNTEYTVDNYVAHNRGGVRLAQAAINELPYFNFAYSVYYYLVSNFEFMLNNWTKTYNKAEMNKFSTLLERKGIVDIEPSEIYTLFKRSTSGSTDSLVDIFKVYLAKNGNFDALEKVAGDENKLNLFKEVLPVFDDFIKNAIGALEKNKGKGNKVSVVVDGYSFDVSNSKYYYVDKFISLERHLPISDVSDSLEDGYPVGYVFSTESKYTDICPSDLRGVLLPNEDGQYMPYSISFIKREENQVMDAIASLGFGLEIKDSILGDKSFVVASTRTVGTVVNLLTVIKSIVDAREGDRKGKYNDPVTIIFNTPTESSGSNFGVRDILDRINKVVLKENNIVIKPVPRSMLDSTVKSERKKGIQTVVVSNYESAARGLDLSSLDKILVTSGMSKQRQAIQFSSRLFSPAKTEAELLFFNRGYDGRFVFPKKEQKEDAISHLLGDTYSDAEALSKKIGGFISSSSSENYKLYEDIESAVGGDIGSIVTKTEGGVIAKRSIQAIGVYDQYMGGDLSKGNLTGASPFSQKEFSKNPISFSKGADISIPVENKEDLKSNSVASISV